MSKPDKSKEQITKIEEKIQSIDNEIKTIKKEISDLDSFFNFGVKHKTDAILAQLKSSSQEMFDTFITLVTIFLFKNVFFSFLQMYKKM